MNRFDINGLISKTPVIDALRNAVEAVRLNPDKTTFSESSCDDLLSADISDAEERLQRFAPFIAEQFSETKGSRGSMVPLHIRKEYQNTFLR